MRTLIAAVATLTLVCSASFAAEQPPAEQILFVCERGSVKSLMATSYFNQLAAQRGLPWRAVSRGVAPDSTTVPKRIAAALHVSGDEQRIERWNDVPPASTSYDAARSSLKAHVAELLEQLSRQSAGGQPDRRN